MLHGYGPVKYIQYYRKVVSSKYRITHSLQATASGEDREIVGAGNAQGVVEASPLWGVCVRMEGVVEASPLWGVCVRMEIKYMHITHTHYLGGPRNKSGGGR